MDILQNKWIVPILAMVLTVSISSWRVYSYLDTTLKNYAQSFHVDTTDHFVYWTFHTQELQQLIDAIAEKRRDLDKREEELKAWETKLTAQSKDFAETKAQIENLRSSISNVIVQSKADEAKNLKTLSSTYAAMSPEAAVAVLNEMDENMVVKLLALMKADTVGPIFEAMSRVPGQEGQMRARIVRISEKLRLHRQANAAQ